MFEPLGRRRGPGVVAERERGSRGRAGLLSGWRERPSSYPTADPSQGLIPHGCANCRAIPLLGLRNAEERFGPVGVDLQVLDGGRVAVRRHAREQVDDGIP